MSERMFPDEEALPANWKDDPCPPREWWTKADRQAADVALTRAMVWAKSTTGESYESMFPSQSKETHE